MEGKYQTRKDDLPVEILRNNVKNADFPIVGIITFADGSQSQDRWMADGSYYGEKGYALDLVPVLTKRSGWMIIPNTEQISLFTKKEYAEEAMEAGFHHGPHMKVVLLEWED